jgi:hypothetical protein
MPGPYTDELRRITRAQSARLEESPAGSGASGGKNTSRPRWRHGPLLALAVVLVLAGAGWLLVQRMMSDAKLQDCVMSGRKNCAPLEVDPVGR